MVDWINSQMIRFSTASVRREEGQAMTEYALVLALIAIATIAALGLLGTRVKTVITYIKDQMPTTG